MERASKLLVGGVCLLLCLGVFARLSSANVNFRPMDIGSLAILYLSATPYALVTPVDFRLRAAVAPSSGTNNDAHAEPALAQATGNRLLAEYVRLHKTRKVSLP